MTLLAPGNRAPPGGEREDLFREWLEAERPGSAKKIISRVRQMHGGKNYDLQFGLRMRGQGPFADLTFQKIRTSLPTPRPLGPPQAVTH